MHPIRLLLAACAASGLLALPAAAQVRLPVSFLENHGQWDGPARYVVHHGQLTAHLEPDAVSLDLGARARLRMVLGGEASEGRAAPVGEGRLPATVRHYRGDDAGRWVTEGAAFDSVRYAEAWPGVDLVVLERDGHLAWDVHLDPGVDPEVIEFTCDGALGLEEQADGGLVVHTAAGPLVQSAPVAWQVDEGGAHEAVEARLVRLDATRFGVAAPERDPRRPLVVDPGLLYGTYLGGSFLDEAQAVAVADDGDVIVVGSTGSTSFPVTDGTTVSGLRDAFVARIDAVSGGLVFATYLGGNDTSILFPDTARSVAVDGDGSLVVAGYAASGDFPTTTGVVQETSAGAVDAFVARFDGAGLLQWSTLFGGLRDDWTEAVALDASGRPTITGRTFSDDFPVTPGAADTTFNALSIFDEAFVARLSADGTSVDYATYLGGQLRDEAFDVEVDAAGVATVTGLTGSTDFPVTAGSFDDTYNGTSGSETDAFVARLAVDGTSVTWGGFLGGASIVEATCLTTLSNGDLLVGGRTETGDMPGTVGAAQDTYGGGKRDGFITRISGDGSTLLWTTYVGGTGDDEVTDVVANPADQATLTGCTTSTDFPLTPDAYDALLGGSQDAVLVRLTDGGDGFLYGTLFGGTDDDAGLGLALDAFGAAYVVGETSSPDMPTTPRAVDSTSNGAVDAFLAHLECPPWIDLGNAMPGFGGKAPSLVGSGTLVGGELFSVILTDAKPNSTAFFFLGFQVGALPFKCGTLVVFPFAANFPFVTFPDGSIPLVAPWPLGIPPGTNVVMQYWLADQDAICNASASNGLLGITP